jgi:hypothetical protein
MNYLLVYLMFVRALSRVPPRPLHPPPRSTSAAPCPPLPLFASPPSRTPFRSRAAPLPAFRPATSHTPCVPAHRSRRVSKRRLLRWRIWTRRVLWRRASTRWMLRPRARVARCVEAPPACAQSGRGYRQSGARTPEAGASAATAEGTGRAHRPSCTPGLHAEREEGASGVGGMGHLNRGDWGRCPCAPSSRAEGEGTEMGGGRATRGGAQREGSVGMATEIVAGEPLCNPQTGGRAPTGGS